MTSGTIFASRKLSFVDLLGAICLFVNAAKGLSAVQLSRDLDVQHKTAFVLMHKLREAQILIEQWRKHYNTKRPHSALGYRPPAPETIVPMDQRPVMH